MLKMLTYTNIEFLRIIIMVDILLEGVVVLCQEKVCVELLCHEKVPVVHVINGLLVVLIGRLCVVLKVLVTGRLLVVLKVLVTGRLLVVLIVGWVDLQFLETLGPEMYPRPPALPLSLVFR